jgi:IPT/TIG domain-containing protein
MKRSWTALAVALVGFLAAAGCNDYGNTFQYNGGAALSSISPANIPAGSADFTLTMNGTGFIAATKVQWNGTTCPTSGTGPCKTIVNLDASNNVISVTATISASLIAKPGLVTVETINPASGTGNNGLSNPINFIINNPGNPAPAVSSVSPACAVTGTALPITVTGTNFLTGSTDASQVSTLNWALGPSTFQFTAPIASISPTQITVTIPAADVNVVGNAIVTVYNPPSLPVKGIAGSTGSGGGSSPASPATTVSVQSAPCPVAAKSSASSETAASIAEETPAVSIDGRYVAYTGVQDGHSQIFLRDTCESAPAGCQSVTTLLSVSGDGSAAASDSHTPSMSSDGRYVAFSSAATNLVENSPAGRQIYLRDTCAGAGESCKPSTQLISADSNGALVGTESILPSVSSSGRFIAFLAITASHSANHASSEAKSAAGNANAGYRQVFIRDTCLGAVNCTPKTTRISLQPGDGIGTDSKPAGPALSGDARGVAIPGGNAAMLFTRSVAVDDRVFLAIANEQR